MKKTLLEIYALAVCFAAMICISISSGIILYDVVQMNYPEATIESYRLDMPFYPPPPPPPVVMQRSGSATASAVNVDALPPEVLNPEPPKVWGGQLFTGQPVEALSEQEIENREKERIEDALKNEQNDARRSLIRMLIILFVSSFVFLIHWRLAKRCQ